MKIPGKITYAIVIRWADGTKSEMKGIPSTTVIDEFRQSRLISIVDTALTQHPDTFKLDLEMTEDEWANIMSVLCDVRDRSRNTLKEAGHKLIHEIKKEFAIIDDDESIGEINVQS